MKTAGVDSIPNLLPHGRFCPESARGAGVLPLFWAGSGVELCFTGEELHLVLEADFQRLEPWIAVEVNGAPWIRMPMARGINDVCVLRGMTAGGVKRVRLFKETQPMDSDSAHRLFMRSVCWQGGEFLPPPRRSRRLEFVGDSLTSGEGVLGAREETDWIPALFSASRTWARLTADALDADWRTVSQSGWGIRSGWDNDPRHALPAWYERVCGPAMGDGNAAMGSQRPNDFSSWQPDAVIVNLGTNDAGAMGNPPWIAPDGARFRQEPTAKGMALAEDAALAFLRQLRRCNPRARLVWAYGMLGDALRPALEGAVERFRREDPWVYYLPLTGATGETMGSRQHPGPLCHQAAAERTAELLRKILP